jgi:hypothetical protein
MTTDDLLAEFACHRIIHRYATAVDAVDIALLRTCFFDDVQASYVGRPFTDGFEPIVEMISGLARLTGTIHNLGPVSAMVTGDTATATAGAIVMAVSAEPNAHGVLRGVKYEFGLAQRDGEWRIVRLVHRVMWATAAPRSGLMGEPPADSTETVQADRGRK